MLTRAHFLHWLFIDMPYLVLVVQKNSSSLGYLTFICFQNQTKKKKFIAWLTFMFFFSFCSFLFSLWFFSGMGCLWFVLVHNLYESKDLMTIRAPRLPQVSPSLLICPLVFLCLRPRKNSHFPLFFFSFYKVSKPSPDWLSTSTFS